MSYSYGIYTTQYIGYNRYNKTIKTNIKEYIKMKCQACDCNLSDYESVRKDKHGDYVDLCSACFKHTQDDLDYFELSVNDVYIESELE